MVKSHPAEQSLWGRINVEKVFCFLFYKKESSSQKLLHALKYKGEKEIGLILGKLFAQELNEVNAIDEIDFIVPVPLHPKKQYRRGYNQSEWISKGISECVDVPINNNVLIKTNDTATQTKKNRFSRYTSVKSMFAFNSDENIKGKHILLVDDVLTTGATIEACYNALTESSDVKVSVLTLAYSVQ